MPIAASARVAPAVQSTAMTQAKAPAAPMPAMKTYLVQAAPPPTPAPAQATPAMPSTTTYLAPSAPAAATTAPAPIAGPNEQAREIPWTLIAAGAALLGFLFFWR